MTAIEFLRSRADDLRAAGRWFRGGPYREMIRCDFDGSGAGLACPISVLAPGGPFPAYDKRGQNFTALGLTYTEARKVMNAADGYGAMGRDDIREAMADAVGLPSDTGEAAR